MAEQSTNPEELALRRRARRRLVGSLALALLAVVVLPMIFEPEPKPLGDDVEIVIPGQDTPFTPPAAIEPTRKVEPAAPVETPVVLPAPEIATPAPDVEAGKVEPKAAIQAKPDKPAGKPVKPTEAKPVVDKPAEVKPTEVKPAVAKPAETKPAEVKPAAKPASKPADPKTQSPLPGQAEPKPVAASDAKSEAKPAIANGSYFLQLGSFGTEVNARKLADRAKAAGYSVKVLAGQDVNKVRVGPYATRDKALDAQSQLKAKGFSPVMVSP